MSETVMPFKLIKKSKKGKRVLITSNHDKEGKSTTAEKYCKGNALKPLCIDLCGTNYTDVPCLDFDLEDGDVIYHGLEKLLRKMQENGYDCLILDGIKEFGNCLLGKGKGLSKYSKRMEVWRDFTQLMKQYPSMSFIFVGQADCEVHYYDDKEDMEPSKFITDFNALVNIKILCYRENGEYKSLVMFDREKNINLYDQRRENK